LIAFKLKLSINHLSGQDSRLDPDSLAVGVKTKAPILQPCQHNGTGDISRFQGYLCRAPVPTSQFPRPTSHLAAPKNWFENYHQRTSGLYLSHTERHWWVGVTKRPHTKPISHPPANMAKYFHCVSADFPHEKGVGKVGSWNSKCDYLRLPICSLLFGPPKLEWELSAPSWMLIDFWLCVLAGGMRWLAQKGSNGRAINRNLCEIVFLERTNEIYRWGMLCICPVCWLNLPMVGWDFGFVFGGIGCDRHRWHIPAGRMTSVNACFVYYFALDVPHPPGSLL